MISGEHMQFRGFLSSWWMFLLAGIMAILIALIIVGYQAIASARTNPVTSLRSEW